LQLLPAQPHSIERTGTEVFDQHIGLRNDFLEVSLGFVRFQIQGEAALVGIELQKKQFVK